MQGAEYFLSGWVVEPGGLGQEGDRWHHATMTNAHISQAMMDEIREIFDHFDKDGNGTIEVGEFTDLLSALGADMDEGEVAVGLEVLDTNGNGRIDFDEFVSWWSTR